jgi:hypothetical protein
MRRIISFVIALCLTVTGAVAMGYLLIFAPWWKGWMVMGAGLVFTAGALWLYEDYINATPNQGK